MTDLSILIPSRNEMFLARTIQDIIEHAESDYEIIAVLDGAWADPPVPLHERVTILYYPESIGQRAATNAAAKIAHGKYLIKCDAHCAFDQGFDVKMMADMQDNWTVVPIMRNLHAFDWVCEDGHRRYQGPSGVCTECGKPTTRDVVWIAKNSPQSKSYCFDTDLKFQYFGEFSKRPEGQGDLTESMSLQGSFFMLTREKYFELNICDESWGSWGNQGTEVSVKTWLSGGRVVVNHKTWYAHLFRTQGGDFGFPYHLSGNQVEHARKCSRDLFLNNKWDKQVRPLSWLIEKFKPVSYWHNESGRDALERVTAAGASFSILNPVVDKMIGVVHPLADFASSHHLSGGLNDLGGGKQMPTDTVGLVPIDDSRSVGTPEVLGVGNEFEMSGIATTPVFAEMIDDSDILATSGRNRPDQPGIHQTVSKDSISSDVDISIPIPISFANPVPAPSDRVSGVDINTGKEFSDFLVTEDNCEIIGVSHSIPPLQVSARLEAEQAQTCSASPIIARTAGIVYYTDCQLDSNIMRACQEQLAKAADGKRIVSVSLQPLSFGDNITLPLERGYLAMFKQILAGLEALDTDIVFFAEHDVLYNPSHFDFTPPRKDRYYYNTNVWKLRIEDGHALHYDCQQTSGLCAYRELLLQHYRERVNRTEAKFNELGNTHEYRNWIRKQGFEPGSHNRSERVDDYKAESWRSTFPNIDIRHDGNLTPSRWSKDQFRDQRFTEGWTESDEIPGWGKGIAITGVLK